MAGRVVYNEAVEGQVAGEVVEPAVAAKKLNQCILRLTGSYILEDGTGVRYKQLGESKEFREEFLPIARSLAAVRLKDMDDTARTAFLLNVYNALTIHAFAVMPVLPASPTAVTDFWKLTCYNIGGLILSLDDMEHGILRGNRAGHWKEGTAEELLEVVLSSPDPREVLLEETAEGKLTVSLSMIFKWYGCDFGDSLSAQLLAYATFLPALRAQRLLELVEGGIDEGAVTYRPYNWSLNQHE